MDSLLQMHNIPLQVWLLSDKGGISVSFVIHPVADIIPGQLNILLAECGVPDDIVHEMEEISGAGMSESGVTLFTGANVTVSLTMGQKNVCLIHHYPRRVERN